MRTQSTIPARNPSSLQCFSWCSELTELERQLPKESLITHRGCQLRITASLWYVSSIRAATMGLRWLPPDRIDHQQEHRLERCQSQQKNNHELKRPQPRYCAPKSVAMYRIRLSILRGLPALWPRPGLTQNIFRP
jgi:hypothetical protein